MELYHYYKDFPMQRLPDPKIRSKTIGIANSIISSPTETNLSPIDLILPFGLSPPHNITLSQNQQLLLRLQSCLYRSLCNNACILCPEILQSNFTHQSSDLPDPKLNWSAILSIPNNKTRSKDYSMFEIESFDCFFEFTLLQMGVSNWRYMIQMSGLLRTIFGYAMPEWAFAPLEEIKTKVLTPAFFADCAMARLRS